MEKMVVVIGEDVGQGNVVRLQTAFPEIDFRIHPTREAFVAAVPEADIIFTKSLPAEAIRAASRLRWVQAGIAGIEGMLANGLRERPEVILTNARGAHGIPMAEVILAMMLAFATGLHSLVREQGQRGRIRDQLVRTKFELHGQTLCVLGLGDIGGTLAHKAKALGMRVLGVRASKEPFVLIDAQYTPDKLLQALAQADHVALCLPLTPQTRSIIGETELRAMKANAYIYNVGRGASIERDALLRALQEGWIAGAGLDVTDPEPLPAGSPLWDMPNVILSQHTSGSSPFNARRITDIFVENLGRYLRGEPLVNVIDRDVGY
jgi:phosphoglycerate dehydrogenase-like enzyme